MWTRNALYFQRANVLVVISQKKYANTTAVHRSNENSSEARVFQICLKNDQMRLD